MPCVKERRTRLDMTAAKIMTTGVLTVRDSESMLDALRLAGCKKVRQVPVLDGRNRVVGVITPRTLMMATLPRYAGKGLLPDVEFAPELPEFIRNIDSLSEKRASELMEKDFAAVLPEASTMEVAALFADPGKHEESVLVVDDRNALLGIISPCDVFGRLWDYSEKKKKE